MDIYDQQGIDQLMSDLKLKVFPQIKNEIEKRAKKSDLTARVVTLQSAPTSSTTSYTINNVSFNFSIGDEVRVVDQDAEDTGGFVFYKLYNLVTEGNVTTAVWGELGGGGSLPFNIYLQGASQIDDSTQIINQGVLSEPESETEEEENENENESNNNNEV